MGFGLIMLCGLKKIVFYLRVVGLGIWKCVFNLGV